MTPDQIAASWLLDSYRYSLLVKDFISGTYFCLADRYPLDTFSSYVDASSSFAATHTFDEAEAIGKSLPSYHIFKSTYPEYFI